MPKIDALAETPETPVDPIAQALVNMENKIVHMVNENNVWRENVNNLLRGVMKAIEGMNQRIAAVSHDHAEVTIEAALDATVHHRFFDVPTDNAAMRIYQNGPDHPVAPGHYVLQVRQEIGADFVTPEVPGEMDEYIATKFIRSQLSPNTWYYVEISRLSAEPIDETSVPTTV